MKFSVLVARGEYWRPKVIVGEVMAGAGKVSGKANQLGVISKEGLPFFVSEFWTDIGRCWHFILNTRIHILMLIDLLHEFLEDPYLKCVMHIGGPALILFMARTRNRNTTDMLVTGARC